MKKLTYLLAIIVLAGIALLYFGVFNRRSVSNNIPAATNQPANSVNANPAPASSNPTPVKLEPKTDSQASVTVKVTPSDTSPQSAEWKFDVAMDTHLVELNQDMLKSAVLVDDQEKGYTPLRWDGPNAGGHHREGTLVFQPISPLPKSIELKISGVGGVIRDFSWQL